MTLDHTTLAAIFIQPAQFQHVRTGLPAAAVASRCGQMARALVAENRAAEQYRQALRGAA